MIVMKDCFLFGAYMIKRYIAAFLYGSQKPGWFHPQVTTYSSLINLYSNHQGYSGFMINKSKTCFKENKQHCQLMALLHPFGKSKGQRVCMSLKILILIGTFLFFNFNFLGCYICLHFKGNSPSLYPCIYVGTFNYT